MHDFVILNPFPLCLLSRQRPYYLLPKDATHLNHQYKELQLADTNKYLLMFPLKVKHSLQHQLT
jgi:hypothetical protein